jgi:hypothetical protein
MGFHPSTPPCIHQSTIERSPASNSVKTLGSCVEASPYLLRRKRRVFAAVAPASTYGAAPEPVSRSSGIASSSF